MYSARDHFVLNNTSFHEGFLTNKTIYLFLFLFGFLYFFYIFRVSIPFFHISILVWGVLGGSRKNKRTIY